MPKANNNGKVALGLIGVIVVGMIVLSQMPEETPKAVQAAPAPPPPAAPVNPDDELRGISRFVIDKAKKAVRERLKDPESAKFKNVSTHKTPAGGLLVCGNVNSKNSFGGYVGFRPFMYATSGVVILQEDMEKKEFAVAYNGSCAEWELLVNVKD